MKQLYVFLLYFFALFLVCEKTEAQLTVNIDPSFNIGTGFSYYVHSIVLQPDGKILVGGSFTQYNGTTQNYIARLNTDGSLDTSFDIGTGFNSWINTITLQPDGKILVGGIFFSYNGQTQNRIIRLNTDGSKDTSFDIGTGYDSSVHEITLQPDGKILVGGSFTQYNGTTQNRIIRLNTDGSIDTSFNIGTGFNDYVETITLQSEGKILVGGKFTSYNGQTRNSIVGLNTDGSIDTSFNIGTGFNISEWSNSVEEIILQPDGKILVGGTFSEYNGQTQKSIVRLNMDGSVDTSFNTGNGFKRQSAIGLLDTMVLQPDGKILVGGNFTNYNTQTQGSFSRLNSDGSLDTSFETGTGFGNGGVYSIILQPDGKILAGGSLFYYNSQIQPRITRLQEIDCENPPPTPEATFIPSVICEAIYPEYVGTLVVTYPLGDEYEYSIDGINYQSSPDFQLWLGQFPITVTAKQGGCISDPLVINNIEENSTLPVADVTQPDCSDVPESGQFGTITVTFPLGDIFQYSIDGVNYQDSPIFFNVPPESYELTFSMYSSENCISDPLEIVIVSTDIPTPEADVIQPDCDNPYGSIVVTTPFANAYEYSSNGTDYQPGNVFENLSAGTYQVTVRKGDCISEILEVTINPAPNVPPIPEATFIQGPCTVIPEDMGTLIVTYPLGDEYEYSLDGVNYQSSPVLYVLTGNYELTARQGSCVSDPLEISNIEQNSVPIADVTQPDCSDVPESGQFGTITVTFPLGDEFQYSIDGENYQNSPVFFNVPPGNYELTFRIGFSMCVSDPLEITVFSNITDIPTVIVTQPNCDNLYGSITVTSPFMDYPPYTYSINGVDYQFSPVFENLPSGTYYVTAQLYAVGCPSDPLEVNIHFTPAIPNTPTVTEVQPNCDNLYGSITVTSPVDEGHELFPSYEYSINGIDYYDHTVFNNLPSGTYYVTVRHLLSGCISDFLEVVLFFEDIPTPTVDVIQPDCNNPYGSIEVTSPENYVITEFPFLSWQYQYSINGTDYQEDVLFENVPSGTYYVTVKQADCVSDPLEVILKENLTCFIPKGISPNGDFLNDEFDLSDFGGVPSVRIFNRYGQEVYSQKDYTNQWKGQSNNGKELQTGTYYYMITFQNEEIKAGWVYLNREY